MAHRRNRQGQATAFKTTAPIQFLIEMIDGEANQLMATLCFYGCARINAVCWLKAEDLRGGMIRFRIEHSKTSTFHAVRMPTVLVETLNQYDLPRQGYLFPARRGNQESRQYRQRWVEGERVTEITGSIVRPVRSVKGFDKSLAAAVERVVSSNDSGIDELISQIPELSGVGRQAFYGVSSHSFRRSRCQYLFYTLGWVAPKCMAISGHKSLDSFYKYIAYQVTEAQDDYVLTA